MFTRQRIVSVLMMAFLFASEGCVSTAPATESDAASSGVAVYALSRGKGVPEPTRRAYNEIKAKLQTLERDGKVVELREQRIGIEGETRLCAVFIDVSVARDEYERLARYDSVDLLNVVLESCGTPK